MSDVAAPATGAGAEPFKLTIQQAAGLALFVAIAAGGLLYAKWLPYSHKLAKLIAGGAYSGKSISGGAWHFTVAYGEAVWIALAAALLIGAGVETLLPRAVLTRTLANTSGSGNLNHRLRTSLATGAASLPCMMCTCCSAPVVRSMRRAGVGRQAALSFWLGNPLLNPAVIVILALVLPWQYAVGRILIGAAVVLLAAPLISRLAPQHQHEAAVPTAKAAEPAEPAKPARPAKAAEPAEPAGPAGYLSALARLAIVLVPEYFVVVLLVGSFNGALMPAARDAGIFAALAVAVVGTVLVVPTAGEVPVVLGLAAAGFSPLAAGAAMIALPALSLPSMVMVGRSLSWRVVAVTGGSVAVAALAAGGLVTALGA